MNSRRKRSERSRYEYPAYTGLLPAITFIIALIYFSRAFVLGTKVAGWTSLFVTLLFVSSFQIALMGVLGIYIGKTFDEAKRRPLYIVRETVNFDDRHV